jgi:hypothetical protein
MLESESRVCSENEQTSSQWAAILTKCECRALRRTKRRTIGVTPAPGGEAGRAEWVWFRRSQPIPTPAAVPGDAGRRTRAGIRRDPRHVCRAVGLSHASSRG